MQPVLFPSGLEALRDAPLLWVLLIGGTLIFFGMMILLGFALRGRAQPINKRLWIIGGGIVFPALVLGTLHIVNLRHLDRDTAVPPGTPVITVTGRMWWWEIRVDDPRDGTSFTSANELVLPVGRPVRIALASEGVLHSFWVPALAGKVDLVPGRIHHLVLQPERPGEWRGPCAEFCGEGHTQMVLHTRGVMPADFEAWRQAQAAPARAPTTPQQQRGLRHFNDLRCVACHTVRGTAQAALTPHGDVDAGGPDLTHLASRRHLGAGTVENNPANLRAWIADTPRLKPGARMPSYRHLDPATLDALVAYLGSLE